MLLKDVLYYALIKGIGVLFWIAILKLNAVYLDPVDFGNFSISLNIAITVATFLTGWQVSSFIRFYHEDGDKVTLYAIIVNDLIKVFLISFLVWCVPLLLTYIFFQGKIFQILLNSMFLSFSFGGFLFITATLRIKRDLLKFLVYTLVFSTTALGFYFVTVPKLGWQAGLVSISLGYSLIGLVHLFIKRPYVSSLLQGKIDLEYKTILFRYGLPVVLIGVLSQLLSTSDLLVLRFYGLDYDVGIYSANYGVAEKSIFAIMSIIVTAFTPLIFKKSKEIGFSVFDEVKKAVGIFLAVSLPLMLILSFFSLDVSKLLLNKAYTEGHYIIPFISLGGVFVGIGSFYAEVLTVNKMTNLLARLYGASMLFNLVSNLIFVKFYGMIAAVATTILSYFMLMILIIYFAKKHGTSE